MSNISGPNIVIDDLVLYLDIGNPTSYSGSDIIIKNAYNSKLNATLNTVNPVAWSLGTFSVYDELSPNSVHFINGNGGSGSYLGFTLLGKKVIKWCTYEVSLTLEVITGNIYMFLGSSGGGYTEGPSTVYGVGTHEITNKVLNISNIYNHESFDLQLSFSTFSVNGEARITNLVVNERLYDGVLVNGPIYNSSNLGNIIFDGSDDILAVGYKTEFDTLFNSGFTMNIWMNLTAGSTTRYIFHRGEFPAAFITGTKYYFYLRDNTTANYIGRNFLKSEIEDIGIFMFTVAWDGTYAGSGFTFYINGNAISSNDYSYGTVTATKPNTSFITLLEDIAGNFYSCAYYNRALSSLEILQNYNATKSRYK